MQVEIKKPNTIVFNITLDRTDKWYKNCLWARLTFDLENWSMTAQSDCGDYSYSWYPETSGRTFLQLMAKIDKGYLLRKISSQSIFDMEATKKKVCRWVRDDEDLSSEEKNRIISEINEIKVCLDCQEFLAELEWIDGMDNFSDLYECVVEDYPTSAKNFAEIFEGIVQPEIRKYLNGLLDSQPTIDPKDLIPHGKWIERVPGVTWECSKCEDVVKQTTDYCPDCGAKMDKE